eukprot:755177-Hanusia_phi.AAC.1
MEARGWKEGRGGRAEGRGERNEREESRLERERRRGERSGLKAVADVEQTAPFRRVAEGSPSTGMFAILLSPEG